MSAYKVVECEIYKEEHVIAALVDMGIPRDAIEIHETPKNLVGIGGKVRKQKAHIIVRREHVNKHLSGGASNDLGFEKVDGTYIAHVSSYDKGWWRKKEERIKQVAAAEHVTEQAHRRGYHVKRVETDGKIKIKLKKNF